MKEFRERVKSGMILTVLFYNWRIGFLGFWEKKDDSRQRLDLEVISAWVLDKCYIWDVYWTVEWNIAIFQYLTFCGMDKLFSKVHLPLYIPTRMYECSGFSIPFSTFIWLFYSSYLSGCEVVLHWFWFPFL